jgi:hypothetical protein
LLSPHRAAGLLVLAARQAGTIRSLGDLPGHEFHGNQCTSGAGVTDGDVADASIAWASKQYPRADLTEKKATGINPREKYYKGQVDGLDVLTDIPNTDSISATFSYQDEYDELPGIREVAIKDLDLGNYTAGDDNQRVRDLADAIKESGEIKPLIVVIDGTRKPYVLEGGHRSRALQLLGKKTLPAVVIVDHTAQKMRGAAAKRKETALHQAADAHLAKMSVALRYAFAMGRKALGTPPDAERAAKAVAKALWAVLPKTLLGCLVDGGRAAVGMLPEPRHAEMHTAKRTPSALKMRFDVNDPNAVAWADRHAAELITQISETTREDINNAITDALEHGNLDEAYDEILAAVGDTDRAEMIARTEVMTAVHEGQREAWGQAVENGLLPDDAQAVWIATEDACPECEALDGEVRDLDGEYSDGSDGPPAHPRCRCTESISLQGAS